MSLPWAVNTGWMVACRPSLRRFHRSVLNVAQTQTDVLMDVVGSNRSCDYGHEYGFDKIKDVDSFRSRVPIAGYEHFEPWIDQICRGRVGVLTSDPVRMLAPTAGSVSGRRLIPYTDSLRRQFRGGIDPWICDLFQACSPVRKGRAYWMVTPTMEKEHTASGLPIGFDDDADYLGPIGRWAASRVMAVPAQCIRLTAPEETPFQTLRRLLDVPDLSLVSVWSPTFLTTLAHLLEESSGRLIASLGPHHPAASILQSKSSLPTKLARLWPQLAVISCWADGAAESFLAEVGELFPDVKIQPKGLISTEAFVSFPLVGHTASALSIRSHFFEFQNVDSANESALLTHELQAQQRYRVIVTTAGGLYRYQTHDVIEVVGFYRQCPLLRFVGRDNKTCDLVGEKLTETFVASSMEKMKELLQISPALAMLVPRRDRPGYRLLLEFRSHERDLAGQPQQIAETLDRLLAQNPYYRHALQVRQLAPLVAAVNETENGSYWNTYEQQCLSAGMRRGDIKPTVLETRFDWDAAITSLETGAKRIKANP